jgi:hypothetical protein
LLTDFEPKVKRLETCPRINLATLTPFRPGFPAEHAYITRPLNEIFHANVHMFDETIPFCWTKNSFVDNVVAPFMGRQKTFQHRGTNYIFTDWKDFSILKDLQERQQEIDDYNKSIREGKLDIAGRNARTEDINYLRDSFPMTKLSLFSGQDDAFPVDPESVQRFFEEFKRLDMTEKQFATFMRMWHSLLTKLYGDKAVDEKELKWPQFVASLSSDVKTTPQFKYLDAMIRLLSTVYSPTRMEERKKDMNSKNEQIDIQQAVKQLAIPRRGEIIDPFPESIEEPDTTKWLEQSFNPEDYYDTYIVPGGPKAYGEEEKKRIATLPSSLRGRLNRELKTAWPKSVAADKEGQRLRQKLRQEFCTGESQLDDDKQVWLAVSKAFSYFLFNVDMPDDPAYIREHLQLCAGFQFPSSFHV